MSEKKEDHKKEKEVKSGLIDKLIDEEKVKLYNMSKTVEGEKRFMLENGEAISNLLELVEHLNKYPETFKKHVGFNKDNFANWIENSLELPYLADKLKEVKDREEYLFLILSEV
ncbi:MAG: hypothetical protein ACMXX7_02285 [Candidatus Woesearchaeota archaeon]